MNPSVGADPGVLPVPTPLDDSIEKAPDDSTERAPRQTARSSRPGRRLWIVIGTITAAALALVFAYVLATRGRETTDDAQVKADVVPLAPRVGGSVLDVPVRENQHVKAGDVVLEIDDADYKVKVQQAEGELAAAQAAVVRARPEARQNALELARSERLRAGEAIPERQFEAAQVAARSGRAGLLQAQANLAAAQAALELARLQLTYTKVVAPGDGRISDIGAHPGQILSAEQPFAQFVPDHAYVVANFKETQTGEMRPGQRASISIDAYPHRSFAGRVESLSAGTGAEFSLLPANNATGNFVKVVQRVPVRIAFVDLPTDVDLRAGLSAFVTVTLH
jgi:membrane fusion protein, multidrug efflux system